MPSEGALLDNPSFVTRRDPKGMYALVHLESGRVYVYVLRTKQIPNHVLQWHALIHLVEKKIESGKYEHQITFLSFTFV